MVVVVVVVLQLHDNTKPLALCLAPRASARTASALRHCAADRQPVDRAQTSKQTSNRSGPNKRANKRRAVGAVVVPRREWDLVAVNECSASFIFARQVDALDTNGLDSCAQETPLHEREIQREREVDAVRVRLGSSGAAFARATDMLMDRRALDVKM